MYEKGKTQWHKNQDARICHEALVCCECSGGNRRGGYRYAHPRQLPRVKAHARADEAETAPNKKYRNKKGRGVALPSYLFGA